MLPVHSSLSFEEPEKKAGGGGRYRTPAAGTASYLSTLSCFIPRLPGDWLAFRQRLSKENVLPKEQTTKECDVTIFRVPPCCKICAVHSG